VNREPRTGGTAGGGQPPSAVSSRQRRIGPSRRGCSETRPRRGVPTVTERLPHTCRGAGPAPPATQRGWRTAALGSPVASATDRAVATRSFVYPARRSVRTVTERLLASLGVTGGVLGARFPVRAAQRRGRWDAGRRSVGRFVKSHRQQGNSLAAQGRLRRPTCRPATPAGVAAPKVCPRTTASCR
jgi:hypothetical protein